MAPRASKLARGIDCALTWLFQTLASTGWRTSRTISTGRFASRSTARETLPSKTPETLPSPREPITIRSASISSA